MRAYDAQPPFEGGSCAHTESITHVRTIARRPIDDAPKVFDTFERQSSSVMLRAHPEHALPAPELTLFTDTAEQQYTRNCCLFHRRCHG